MTLKKFFHNNIINEKKIYLLDKQNIEKILLKILTGGTESPASRNPLISDLHKKITILETLDKVKGLTDSSIQIIVNTKKFKYLLKEWLNKEKIPITTYDLN